jgi:hypothetical protein
VRAAQTVVVEMGETVVPRLVARVGQQVPRQRTLAVLPMQEDSLVLTEQTEVFKVRRMQVVMQRQQVVREEMVLRAVQVERPQVHLREA